MQHARVHGDDIQPHQIALSQGEGGPVPTQLNDSLIRNHSNSSYVGSMARNVQLISMTRMFNRRPVKQHDQGH